jgi:hypothetical protein
MTRFRFIWITLGVFVLLIAPALCVRAASMGVSGGHDLDALWDRARKDFDPSRHDAIVLLEKRRIEILGQGGTRTTVHRAVWLGTTMGIRDHADLRIPYDSGDAAMTVKTLRTWRDDAWWPRDGAVSGTAVVETLPFAVAAADDYSTMRETMLLHDGVGLPCVVETAYEIEERGAPGDGADGLWVFAQNDPAELVELVISVPEGARLAYVLRNGAPEPETAQKDGETVYTWRMKKLDRLGSPRVADPASYAPYVAWSTWPSWETLGARIVSSFDAAAVIDKALADTLEKRLEYVPSQAARARAVASFVDESTRSIHTDTRRFPIAPRGASRVWETGYGHGIDRAVLAAALLRSAGLGAEPVYRSMGPDGIDEEVPGLSRFDNLAVWVHGDGVDAVYDPLEGTLTDGPLPLYGRTVWKPATGIRPSAAGTDAGAGRFDLVLTIEPAEGKEWKGHGYLDATGVFSPHARMTGLQGEALVFLKKLAGSVIDGAVVTGYTPERFERDDVAVGFEFVIDSLAVDTRARTVLAVGTPEGGLMAQLPTDVHLYDERRTSPVGLPGKMTQTVTVRLKTGDHEIISTPDNREIVNRTGKYDRGVEKANGWIVVRRETAIDPSNVLPGEWPDLRALLLEEAAAEGRTILVK